MTTRTAQINRDTKETKIKVDLNLDGKGHADIKTGLAFFDHMLDQIAKHALFDPVSYTHLTLPTTPYV